MKKKDKEKLMKISLVLVVLGAVGVYYYNTSLKLTNGYNQEFCDYIQEYCLTTTGQNFPADADLNGDCMLTNSGDDNIIYKVNNDISFIQSLGGYDPTYSVWTCGGAITCAEYTVDFPSSTGEKLLAVCPTTTTTTTYITTTTTIPPNKGGDDMMFIVAGLGVLGVSYYLFFMEKK